MATDSDMVDVHLAIGGEVTFRDAERLVAVLGDALGARSPLDAFDLAGASSGERFTVRCRTRIATDALALVLGSVREFGLEAYAETRDAAGVTIRRIVRPGSEDLTCRVVGDERMMTIADLEAARERGSSLQAMIATLRAIHHGRIPALTITGRRAVRTDGERARKALPDAKPWVAALAMLRKDPSLPDREIARTLGCSPSTVGTARAKGGFAATPRKVRRGKLTYGMRARGEAGARTGADLAN